MGWTNEQVEAARSATPGTSHVIHFNNAGCSLPTKKTLDAVIGYLNNEANFGGYETFDASTEDLERPYTALASLLNCHRDEIAIVTSATEAWQQVIYGLASSSSPETSWRPGDRLLTSICEYGSNYIAYLQLQKRIGIKIDIIPENDQGDLDLVALRNMLLEGQDHEPKKSSVSPSASSSRVVLVSINHVPTSSGRVYNVHGVGSLTKEFKIPFLLDACQSVGQLPVDVTAIGCDFLSGTGRKYLRAARGSGFLYCSKEAMRYFEPATLDNTGAAWCSADNYELRPTARRFERYEMSFAAKVGLGIAVEQCVQLGMDPIWERIQYLANLVRSNLEKIEISGNFENLDLESNEIISEEQKEIPIPLPDNAPHLSSLSLKTSNKLVQVQDRGALLCGIISFIVLGKSADEVQKNLFNCGINTSVSRTASSRLDFEKRDLFAVVRVSVHYFNTEKDIEKLVDAIKKCCSR